MRASYVTDILAAGLGLAVLCLASSNQALAWKQTALGDRGGCTCFSNTPSTNCPDEVCGKYHACWGTGSYTCGPETYCTTGHPICGDLTRVPATDAGGRQPLRNEPPHSLPGDAALLTAPSEGVVPEPAYPEAKDGQRPVVHGHAVIPDVPADKQVQPLPLRSMTHDSEPMWAADPSPYDFFVHYTSPVYPGAHETMQ